MSASFIVICGCVVVVGEGVVEVSASCEVV